MILMTRRVWHATCPGNDGLSDLSEEDELDRYDALDSCMNLKASHITWALVLQAVDDMRLPTALSLLMIVQQLEKLLQKKSCIPKPAG
eukprot:3259612-Amphidinium_carterae.2